MCPVGQTAPIVGLHAEEVAAIPSWPARSWGELQRWLWGIQPQQPQQRLLGLRRICFRQPQHHQFLHPQHQLLQPQLQLLQQFCRQQEHR